MTARPVPQRHWRSYGDDPLPTGAEALDEPLAAFPSWLMRITCDRCDKDRMIAETHAPQRDMLIRDIIARMRHDGCGGRPGRWSCLPASKAPAAGRCGRSWCGRDDGWRSSHPKGSAPFDQQATDRIGGYAGLMEWFDVILMIGALVVVGLLLVLAFRMLAM